MHNLLYSYIVYTVCQLQYVLINHSVTITRLVQSASFSWNATPKERTKQRKNGKHKLTLSNAIVVNLAKGWN